MGFEIVGQLPLTDECHHYYDIEEVPWDLQKYWHQRYSIFSYYDDDVYLTDDAWFGVTPEPVAIKIAQDLAAQTPAHKTTLIDLFGGAGGNTIAFAQSGRWARVVAIERDAATLACAQHNAAARGVPAGAVTWVLGDSFDYLAAARPDPATTAVFASPPWGGVGYRADPVFDLRRMRPYDLDRLHRACRPLAHALYLPRTSDLREIAGLAPDGERIDVVQYCMEGASKALVAYVPQGPGGSEERDG